MPGAASKSKVAKVLPAGKPDWSRWRWMRREERSAISISRSEASRLAAGQPSRSAVSVRRFQLRLMLGRRKAFSRVGDRKSVVEGKGVSGRVDLGGARNIKKKNKK